MSKNGFIESDVAASVPRTRQGTSRASSLAFAISKHLFDFLCAVCSIPVILLISFALLLINPILNPGPLFYTQRRMGKNHQSFTMIKFRTMLAEGGGHRCHKSGIEAHRITRLGTVLRRYRIDELPNMFNVLLGQMSVIGPRPDCWAHAVEYAKIVPLYDTRHRVRPGITGLAQVEFGYAEGIEQTVAKARYDHLYIECYGLRQELQILLKTIRVITTGFGAR